MDVKETLTEPPGNTNKITESESSVDLIVIGSGAAGLCAAITARKQGLSVVVLEKESTLGGTTAVSGGWAWIPGSSVAARAGVKDSKEAVRLYLKQDVGEFYSNEHIEAYLDAGPRMVDFLEQHTEVRFMASPNFPDYHSEAPGAGLGRSIVAEPYDARALGDKLPLLRMPLKQTTLFGMNVGSGEELTHFFRATRSLTSALFVSKRMVRHVFDLLRYKRGTRLANGNALVARLLKSAFDLGIDFRISSPVCELLVNNEKVGGVVIDKGEKKEILRARAGVVIACGGFSQDIGLRQQLFRHAPTGREHASPVPVGNIGDGLRLGQSVGGVIENQLPNAAAWMPVSLVPQADGSQAVFPHVVDRAKPGMIAVTRHGSRFVNESNSYHDFCQAIITATQGEDPSVFLICDKRAIRRYGLGAVKPFPFPVKKHIKSGYLLYGQTIADLARYAGIDVNALESTVREFNESARLGQDSKFGKGTTRYNKFQGDAMHTPSPCVAPLEHGPFFAVRVRMGDIGTFAGLRADASARVLDGSGKPIAGLYVAGNDMCSILGGNYSGAGINIGPALTFGYIAALHAASVSAYK